ncbi:MAG: hypothetical protein ACJAS4_003090 [Bacteriovoracaceae bacterium]|jgi:hypothetical protein
MSKKDNNDQIQKLNKTNSDGSINSFQETKKLGHGYSVKISHPEFQSQIEPAVLPHIMLLISKGYVTVTSCQGHGLLNHILNNTIRRNDGPQITVSLDENKRFCEILNSWIISCKPNKTMESNGLVSIRCRYSFLPNSIQRMFIYKALLKL